MSLAISNLIMIAGPTASGKSGLAVKLAGDLRGEVLNIDSVQIFQECDVASGKVTPQERAGIRHHLLDIRKPDQSYNVADFYKDATCALAEIRARQALPVAVGGTGMYVRVLFHGLADLPAANEVLRKELQSKSTVELLDELQKVDPESAAKLHQNDRLRIERALEIFRLSGKSAEEIRLAHAYKKDLCRGLVIVLCWSRRELYQRINQRCSMMLHDGLVDETSRILAKYGDKCAVLKSLGYQQAWQYLKGELLERDLLPEIATQTRQFAKRQTTFWRNEPIKRNWKIRPEATESAIEIDFGLKDSGIKPIRAFSLKYRTLLDMIKNRLSLPFENIELWYIGAADL